MANTDESQAAQTPADLTREHRTRRSPHTSKGPAADPFDSGQVHPVRDVEGIGELYGELLDGIEVRDTRKLWNADATYVAGALKITPSVVSGWQSMAELMAVTGIGKQYAELLVRADVSSIEGLAGEAPQALLNRIQRLEKQQTNRIQGNTIGLPIVQSWIQEAQRHYGVAAVTAAGGSDGLGA